MPALNRVQLIGRLGKDLKTDKYEDKGGETKYYTKVVVQAMQMLDKKQEDEPVTMVEEEQADYEA
jgi:single-stranded DNA-binding protein